MESVMPFLNWTNFTIGIIFCGVVTYLYWSTTFFLRKFAVSPGDETVLITGCDSGIGYQCAKLYDGLGFQVLAGCLFPDGSGAQRLVQETSSRLRVLGLDITNEAEVKNAFEIVNDYVKNKGLWGLLNNAGVLCYGEFEWYSWNQCQKQVNVNLLGTIFVVKTFLPLIKKRKGRILTITSVNGIIAYPGLSVYCATKFALEGFCNSLRLEMRNYDVNVITIQLGDFARLTNILANHKKDVEEMWNSLSQDQRTQLEKTFWNFHDLVQKKCGLTSPVSFEKSHLFEDLKDAILSSSPKVHYLCMPKIHRIILRLLLVFPSSLSDWVLWYAFKKVFQQ